MDTIIDSINWVIVWHLLKAILLLIAGYVIAKIASSASEKFCCQYATKQQCMILKKCVFFGILILFLIASLQQLNFKLTVLLGSAGIATAAIGFAAKTSISNMISGVFLIIEKSFQAGDTIKIKGVTGVVDSIDLLSVKLTTFDHTLVRLPNEMIISNELINLTHYPHRRLDIFVGVSYSEKIDNVRNTLLSLVEKHELALKKPEPSVIITDFGDSSVNMRLSVYVNKTNYGELKMQLHDLIKSTFDKQNIDIPFPQVTVHMEKD